MPIKLLRLSLVLSVVFLAACSRFQVVPDETATPTDNGQITNQPPVVLPQDPYPAPQTYPNPQPAPTNTYNGAYYTVQAGEGLYRIALNHGIADYKQLAAWNNIPPPYNISPGQRLRMTPPANVVTQPQQPVYQPQPSPSVTYNNNTRGTYHTVARGDTLYKISKMYGTSVSEIMRLNNLSNTNIGLGQQLLVSKASTNTYAPAPTTTYTPQPTYAPAPTTNIRAQYHTVSAGETLYRIATFYGLKYLDIARWNNIPAPYDVKVGQQLLLTAPNGQSTYTPDKTTVPTVSTVYTPPVVNPTPKSEPVVVARRTDIPATHTIQRGETIYTLSDRYGIPARDIARWNNINPPYILAIGDTLKLHDGTGFRAASAIMPEPVQNYHIVQDGETLSSIAQCYRLSTQEVAAWSRLTPPYIVRAGQKLTILTR